MNKLDLSCLRKNIKTYGSIGKRMQAYLITDKLIYSTFQLHCLSFKHEEKKLVQMKLIANEYKAEV